MRLNPSKCKIMRMCFFCEQPILPVFAINGRPVDSVSSRKVLGLTLQSDLRWNSHVDCIVPKAAKRLYILHILRCSDMSTTDLITVYVTIIRPLLEYGRIVWHFSLPLCLSDKLESVQKIALRIILPHYSYASALEALSLPSLLFRPESLWSKSFSKLTSLANPRFMLLLPPRRRDAHDSAFPVRNSSNFQLPAVDSERFKRSFILSMLFRQLDF